MSDTRLAHDEYEKRVRELLGHAISDDGGLFNLGWYLGWTRGHSEAVLDGKFTADELEAIAWWMRNYSDPAPDTDQDTARSHA